MGLYTKILLETNVKFLLRKIRSRSNLKINLISLHIVPELKDISAYYSRTQGQACNFTKDIYAQFYIAQSLILCHIVHVEKMLVII
jgi:hypothetical protein